MSLILDALNRSRDDANPVPGLSTHHAIEQVAVNRRQYLLWVALAVAVVLIAWLFMERYSAPQPARETVSSREQAVAIAPVIEPAVESTPVVVEVSNPVPVEQSAPPQLEIILPAEIEVQSASVSTVDPVPEPIQAPPENDAIAKLYENPDLAEPVIRQPQRQAPERPDTGDTPIDVDKMIKLAQEEAQNVGLPDHPVPFLIDLSQQVKDSVPTVYYLRHDYSSDASRSTVVLNSKTLSVGGSPAAGMKVEEILPDSVVLNYQGTQFRLRALNSWINL